MSNSCPIGHARETTLWSRLSRPPAGDVHWLTTKARDLDACWASPGRTSPSERSTRAGRVRLFAGPVSRLPRRRTGMSSKSGGNSFRTTVRGTRQRKTGSVPGWQNRSTSPNVGLDSQSPGVMHNKAPQALARFSRSGGSRRWSNPLRYPATNASPAPTVSTTSTVNPGPSTTSSPR